MGLIKNINPPKPTGSSSFALLRSLSTPMIGEVTNVQQAALKTSDGSDAGKSDVVDKAISGRDVSFSLMRNTINSSERVTGSDVANYIERAEELNDEVDTVPFGLETDDGQIVKVYVNAEQADRFEEAMKQMLGMEDDIEEAINRLTTEFDIVDVVWPSGGDEGEGQGGQEEDPDANLTIDDSFDDPADDDDFAPDQYDVIADRKNVTTNVPAADADTDASDEDEEDEHEEDELDATGKKKKKKKKPQPPEPVEDDETPNNTTK